MNDSPASASQPAQQAVPILVWDAPVRVFHWLMAGCFAGAYLTGENDRLRLLHITLGYTMAGLVAFRIVWGLVGTRYARFADFVRGPRAIAHYLRSLASARPEHHTGHNPAGAAAILALLGLAIALTATGWALEHEIGGGATEESHEVLANLMLLVVILHIGAVLVSSWLHHENLIGAMVTGRKRGAPRQAIGKRWRSVATLLFIVVLGYWWLQWRAADQTRPQRHPPPENGEPETALATLAPVLADPRRTGAPFTLRERPP